MSNDNRTFGLGRVVASCVLTAIMFPLLILGLAGNWRWIEGWIFALWFAAMIDSVTVYLYVKDPALLAERAQRPGSKNQKRWDKYALSGIYVVAIVWLCIMPLDAERFGWSPDFPLWLTTIGGLLLAPSLYLIVRATADNTYLSTLVRIQDDRGHRVVSTGTYAFVRHPLYLGCVLLMVGAPLLLGSVWGLVITGAGLALLVARILGEERMLLEELEGYDGYARKVRYRLIPRVW